MDNAYGRVNLSVGFNPTSAFPVDIRAHFDNAERMVNTVNENDGPKEVGSFDSKYYFGQLITLSFDSHTKSSAYLVVKDPSRNNLLKLTDEEETEKLNKEIVKIGKMLDFTGYNTGLEINNDGKLAIKLTNNSGLHITQNGLEIKTDTTNRGNVIIKNSPDGLYGECCWKEFS